MDPQWIRSGSAVDPQCNRTTNAAFPLLQTAGVQPPSARKDGPEFAVRVSHHDLHVLRTGRVMGHSMARFHRPLTCTAPLPGESTPRRRSPRPRSASAEERSHALPPAPRSFAPEKAALRAQHFKCMVHAEFSFRVMYARYVTKCTTYLEIDHHCSYFAHDWAVIESAMIVGSSS